MSGERTSPPVLRMGIMCRGTTFEAWQGACIRELLSLGFVEPALLIVDDAPPPAAPSGLARARAALTGGRGAWNLYQRLLVRGRLRSAEPVDMSASLGGVPVLRVRPERQGRFAVRFAQADVEAVRRAELDFVLRFAFGIIKGEILAAPRYGVWSFHHDDLLKYRGFPACFWPMYFGEPTQGVTLQRLTEGLDKGVVLHSGHFICIRHSYAKNRDAAFLGSTDFPAKVCRDIRAGNVARVLAAPSATTAPVRTVPTGAQTAVFAAKVASRRLVHAVRTLFRHEQWSVGIVDAPIHSFLSGGVPGGVRWLPPMRRGSFVADPFGVERDGVLTVLGESLDDREGLGRISVLTGLDAGAAGPPRPVLVRPFHLSYPYLFCHEGEIYLVPEMCEARRVEIFRAAEFPARWERIAVVLDNRAVIDPTIVRWEGRWWMFGATKERYEELKLHAWHARELSGPWLAHACNPLKCDVRSSRPAGTPFVHDGALYRPAQDCSRTYGGAVAINRVTRLTPTEFEEETVTIVRPDPRSPFPDGLHTLSVVGNRTLIDGKRTLFIPREFAGRVRRALWSRGGERGAVGAAVLAVPGGAGAGQGA